MLSPGRILVVHQLTRQRGERSEPATVLKLLAELVPQLGLTFGSLTAALEHPSIVALTVDDGYADLVDIQPWLTGQGIVPTVFLPTAFLGKENTWDHPLTGKKRHLSKEQVIELVAAGVEFGTHTHTHADLTSLGITEQREELQRSAAIIEELTGRQAEYLAYRFGKHDRQAAQLAAELGLKCAFLSAPGGTTPFAFGRMPIWNWDNRLTLEAKLSTTWLTPIEKLKSQIISCFSHLTPALKSFSHRA